jgi:hypothetical protein
MREAAALAGFAGAEPPEPAPELVCHDLAQGREAVADLVRIVVPVVGRPARWLAEQVERGEPGLCLSGVHGLRLGARCARWLAL